MASLDDLNDGQIRVKLTELGYPVGPITTTTRKVLLKKLKYLLEQSKSPISKDTTNRASLTKYSSGEESDGDVSMGRSRRSMPPPKSPEKPIKRRSLGRRVQEDDVNDTVRTEFLNPSANSTLNSSEFSSQKYSPKNVVAPESNNISPKKSKHNERGIFNLGPRSHYPQEAFDTGSDSDGLGWNEVEHILPGKSPYSSYVPSSSSELNLPSTRSRFQPQFRSSASEIKYTAKVGLNSETSNHSSPFRSDYLRKLSSASSSKPGTGASLPTNLLDVKESDDEDTTSTRSHSFSHTGTIKKESASTFEEHFWKNAYIISRVMLFIVVVFFGGLGMIYLNLRFKETQISTTDAVLPICKVGEKPGATCVLSAEVQPSLKMFQEIYKLLNEKALELACGGQSDVETSFLSEAQLSQLLVQNSQLSLWDVEKHFGNIRVLINANPQWGVEIKNSGFNIPSPNLPLGCYIFSLFYGFVGSALRLIVVALIVLGIIKGVHWWFEQKEQNKKEVFRMVENIIDILSTHHQSSAGNNLLAISHVRDQLIPPHLRDKKASIWAKAVAYIENNESRVRSEVRQMAGEEFQVWRWLHPRMNGKRKVWQGQAFETMDGSVNSLPISPTPCLKIRHMFDSDIEVGSDWMTGVQDAILEKCDGVNVLHIVVDKHSNEGLVYLKCASAQDAGRAYRALHGSWFDTKLVTVKYLRLERYHERFPEAARCIVPLRPSNDRKLSLQ